jgi:hypothetical protein
MRSQLATNARATSWPANLRAYATYVLIAVFGFVLVWTLMGGAPLSVLLNGDDGMDYDRTTVTIEDENGTQLGTVDVRISDTPRKRWVGLSNTTELPNGTGMLFVHEDEARRSYVMRRMDFPIDIVFVDANGTITAIHHAETEPNSQDDLTQYGGTGRFVLEVPYHWTTRQGIETGDHLRIPPEARTAR